MKKGITLALVFLTFISACTNAPNDQKSTQLEVQENKEEQKSVYSIDQFFNKFGEHFNIYLQKESTQKSDKYTYYQGNDEWAIIINNEQDYIHNYEDLFTFIQNEMSLDKNIIEKQKTYATSRQLVPEVHYIIEETGVTEHVAIVKSYLTLYLTGNAVRETETRKWFYYFCAPNIVVKVLSKEISNSKPTRDKEDVLTNLKNNLQHYEEGISGYPYGSNSRAMRNVICPTLPTEFNKDFKKLSKEGKL